jgi:pantoate--beta-alanine ligase
VRTVERIAELRALIAERRREGARVALVPTMGALHEGHLSLVDEGRRRADVVVMSIFVNPLQFGAGEDFTRYPRDLDGDAKVARGRGVDVLFAPSADEMYGRAREVSIVPAALAAEWEGAARPGHFAGVLTVVAKLFNIAQPDVAVFGRKDLQQATLVGAMVRDLDFPIELVVAPTVREPDGLAMSSRNAYLDAVARQAATSLSRALRAIERTFAEGERDAAALERAGRGVIDREPGVSLEYLAVVEPEGLRREARAAAGSAAIVAARVGGARLIDNVILGER